MYSMEEVNASRKEVTTALSYILIADILPDMPKPLTEMTAADIAEYQDAILERVADIKTAAMEAVEALEGLAELLKC